MTKQYGKWWIELTLILVVYELTYINSKSIYYLIDGQIMIDSISAIIGSLAYSMVTVQIMLNSEHKLLKVTFPVFDAFLMFCGFNLTHAGHLLDNPIRFYLSIIIAVFTGLITYSIGQINAKKQSLADSESKQVELNRIIDDQNRIIEDLKLNQIELKRLADESKRKAVDLERLATEYLQGHIKWENFIGKKKSEKNGYEALMEKLNDQVKSGKTISIEKFREEVANA